ncbi:MAG TPA: DNA polymerase IV [Polyangiaceae bacterium]|nr:DNA polymerase IV [Polyangiaceae bacterium]
MKKGWVPRRKKRRYTRSEMPERTIFHVDMDAFYAAIEQRDHPELLGKPVIVGGVASRRGVVSTASYEARVYGVHSAMPMAQALRKCPHGIVMPVRMSHYIEVSRQIMAVLHSFSPLVEPLSLDEAFLDMTGTQALHGSAETTAKSIKQRVLETTSLTCSVGVADNKFLAKLASDLHKPNGITLVPPGEGASFIAPLPIRRLWGVGPRTAQRLEKIGFKTIGDVASIQSGWLVRVLGEASAEHLQALARGHDDRPVIPDREAKSIGSEETLDRDITGQGAVLLLVRRHCERVAFRLRQAGLQARGIRVKLRYQKGFRLTTRETTWAQPCDDSRTMYRAALGLVSKLDVSEPIRLVGVGAVHLEPSGVTKQGDLFEHGSSKKDSRLEHTLDAIRMRFGDVIRRAQD